MNAIQVIADHANRVGPRCGEVQVIAIDGPAGSGKTTLATQLTEKYGGQLVHMDDLYPGWQGMREAAHTVQEILNCLAQGRVATYRRYDWLRHQFEETHTLYPHGLVIIEGVGSVRSHYLKTLSLVVFVYEPDPHLRFRRAIDRDGPEISSQLEQWMHQEALLHQDVGLPEIADVVIDGRGQVLKA